MRSFKYLGYTIRNSDESQSLGTRIGSAFQKWNELKHVLTDHRIHLSTRVKFLTACVRSRLLYSVQTWQLTANDLRKIEVVWHGFLRKMVKGGYKRKNVPDNNNNRDDPQSTRVEGELDWSFMMSNADLREKTKTLPIKPFCFKQHLQYIAHICRLQNTELQKQLLFDTRSSGKWTKYENLLGLDAQQIRRTMMSKPDFKRLLDTVLTGAP